jgi:hypothetical protein
MKLSRIRGAFPWRMAVIPFERSALLLIKSLGSATQSGPVGVKRGVHFISAGSIERIASGLVAGHTHGGVLPCIVLLG